MPQNRPAPPGEAGTLGARSSRKSTQDPCLCRRCRSVHKHGFHASMLVSACRVGRSDVRMFHKHISLNMRLHSKQQQCLDITQTSNIQTARLAETACHSRSMQSIRQFCEHVLAAADGSMDKRANTSTRIVYNTFPFAQKGQRNYTAIAKHSRCLWMPLSSQGLSGKVHSCCSCEQKHGGIVKTHTFLQFECD